MILHHPSDATLIARAAGTLPPLHARVLDVHIAACPLCRDGLHDLEEVGGAFLAALPPASLRPDALTRTLARLDDQVTAAHEHPPAPGCGNRSMRRAATTSRRAPARRQ